MAKGIYRRGNIYWIRYAGIDGRVKYESSGSDKFKIAEKLLIKRKESIQEGKQPEIIKIKNHLFKELVSEYVKWANRQKSFNSKFYLIKQLSDQFGYLPLRRFNTMLVEQYQTERLQRNKPATVNRLLATLSHMFTKAVDWHMVEEETLKRIRKVKMLPENNRRLRYLSKDECQELIKSCEPHLRPIVITGLNTGMRKGEILNLKWNQVDLIHGFILLNAEDTKNNERKEIPINQTLKETFQSLTRRLNTDYVFYNSDGKPYQDVKRSFNTACRRSKIHDFKFHDLRHTFASHLVISNSRQVITESKQN